MKRSSSDMDPTVYDKEELEKVELEKEESKPKSRSRPAPLTEEERYNRRILANRNSARNSYLRRRKMIDDLYSTVDSLTKERDEFEQECKRLRNEVSELQDELLVVRKRLQIHQQIQPNRNSLSLLNNSSLLNPYHSTSIPLQQLEIYNSMNFPLHQSHNLTLGQSQSGLLLPTSNAGSLNMQSTNDAFRISQLMYQQQLQILESNAHYNNSIGSTRSTIGSLTTEGDGNITVGYNRDSTAASLHEVFSRSQFDPDDDITDLL
jgi:hypothetical protein